MCLAKSGKSRENVIYTNQIEVHPFLQNRKVIEHCKANNVRVTGYMPLAVGKVMEDVTLQKIAAKHSVTVSEVAIAWQIQQGIATIPSSTKKVNLDTNLKAVQLTLTDDDMYQIQTLDRNDRIANPEFSPKWD
ncbi:aldo/keto reductase [Alishewanella sp. HL-SH05]|uniref:aldo/keto reductase n=1 Tax=Alishewanella sp. HL-SH05 TaxID=3461145 RepID=UPI004042B729